MAIYKIFLSHIIFIVELCVIDCNGDDYDELSSYFLSYCMLVVLLTISSFLFQRSGYEVYISEATYKDPVVSLYVVL